MASKGGNGHFVPAFAAALALIGLIVLMLVEYKSTKPVKNETMIQGGTTDASAAAAGATVAPTERRQELEPAVNAPKEVPK
jgi:hypothetical protein